MKLQMKTPITYYGGKQTILKHILPLIPKHSIYTEPFCGGSSVLFAKRPVRCEVINDLNGELINFYRIAKMYYPRLKEEIELSLHSRRQHAEATYIYTNPEGVDDVKRAWALWMLSKTAFASMLNGSFGYDFGGGVAKKLRNSKDEFTNAITKRLEHVTIECCDALEILQRYDRSGAFHFVDPPYVNSDCGHYEGVFNDDCMVKLLEQLANLQGKFMLTMFPYEPIAEYAERHGWLIHRIERFISASKESRRRQEEWIVCNYSAEDVDGQLTIF